VGRAPDGSSVVRPIRVLFVIGTLDVGGAETQLVEAVTRLDRRRFSPVVCCLAAEGPLTSRLRESGIAVHALGFSGFVHNGRRLAALPRAAGLLRRLYRLVRDERPDIVHGVLFWAYVLAAFVGRAARVPVIVASRRSLGLYKADKPHYLLIERLADRFTDLFIANSEAVRLDTIARERIDPARILVVHNGVDFSRFAETTRLAEDGRAPRVIVVSNLIHYKGHRFFLEAWTKVIARVPAARALLVGEGVMRDALQQQARDLGIEHSIEFLGRRDDVAPLLGTSDVYVHPSLQEGYSNAVLEAMASGCPIVATAVGGNVEAITDGETGLLVPPGDADSLATAMLRLLEHRDQAIRMGQQAAAVVRARHDICTVVQAYEAIYTRLVAGETLRYQGSEHGIGACAV